MYERSRGDRYALTALRNKRAAMASEIKLCEQTLRHLRESLVHVDATLRLLDPETDFESLPKKRLPKYIKLFRQGELGRMILDALRQAKGESATVAEITSFLLAAGGHGESARRAVAGRVRGNLAYLERKGKVEKDVTDAGVVWRLT